MALIAEGGTLRIWRTINWLINAAVLLVFLPWFAYFAYVRATTPPRGAADPPAARKPHDAGARMKSAVESLPKFVYSPSSPRTSYWPHPLSPALNGEWDAPARPLIAAVSAYVTRDDVTLALEKIVGLASEDFDVSSSSVPWRPSTFATDIGVVDESEISGVAWTLLCRARQRQSERRDTPGAAADLAAALKLLSKIRGSESYYAYEQSASPASEIMRLAYDAALDSSAAAGLIDALRSHAPLRVSDGIMQVMQLGAWRREIERHYTGDDNGDGWLVVSTLPSWTLGATSGRRSGLWNIGAPLFRSRREITVKLADIEDRIRSVDRMTAGDAQNAVNRLPMPLFDVRDGPFYQGRVYAYGNYLDYLVASAYRRVHGTRAAIIACALSAYRHRHGAYPGSLAALVPDFLGEVPISQITQEPFRYDQPSESSYTLDPLPTRRGGAAWFKTSFAGYVEQLQFPLSRPPASDP